MSKTGAIPKEYVTLEHLVVLLKSSLSKELLSKSQKQQLFPPVKVTAIQGQGIKQILPIIGRLKIIYQLDWDF